MSRCKYNFTNGFNKDVKDKAPDWMDSLFNGKIEKKEVVKIHDLYNMKATQENDK